MRWRKAGIFAVLALGLLLWAILPPAEPELHGRRLRYWVLPWEHSRFETAESVDAAHAAMEERHVRWLIRELGWKPSMFRAAVAGLLNGISELVASTPALPHEVSSPGARRSTSRTDQPRRCSSSAHDTPTMPAPSTITDLFITIHRRP